MPSSFDNLVVTWYDATDTYATSANITPDVSVMPMFTDVGSGEVNEAILVVRALSGRYVTSTSPKAIDEFDRIKIALDDKKGTSYSRTFEIQDIVPSETKGEGTLLTLRCLGIEYHTQQINMAFPFWFSDARHVGGRIGLFYERNRGTKQPQLNVFDTDYVVSTKIGNDLPKFTNNHYEYAMNEDTCYNRWMDVIDKLGASVANGGVLDFFELSFNTPAVNEIDMRIFSSGAAPEDNSGTPVTIKPDLTSGDTINPAETEGGISNATGTNVMAWGDPTHGSLPLGHSIYESGIIQFVYRPEWDNGITYKTDARIVYLGQHYKSLVDSNLNNTPPGITAGVADVDANWSQIDMGDEFGDSITYSVWTDGKVAEWIDCGTDTGSHTGPVSTKYTGTGAGFLDYNMVIDNDGFFRTWVNSRAHTTAELNALVAANTDWSIYGAVANLPRGFRILCETVGTGVFSGKDINNQDYDFSIVEVQTNPRTGLQRLVVIYHIDETDANNDKMQCLVINEGKIYQWNDSANTWDDNTTTDLVNDCIHPWSTIEEAASFDFAPAYTTNDRPDITKNGVAFTGNIDSAIKVVYDFNVAFTDRVNDQAEYFRHWCGINWQVPFPPNDITNSIGAGGIYGGAGNTTDSLREPATLDTTNMGFTPSGFFGFNESDSESLGQLHSLAFMLRLKLEFRKLTDGTLGTADGPGKFRAWMIDTKDNTVIQDFEITSTEGVNWYRVDLPFAAFKLYKAHKPRFVVANTFSTNNPKLNDLNKNIFEFRNIKFIGIQLQDMYDEFGRFAPEVNTLDFDNTGLTAAFGGKATLELDDWHFKKVLLTNSIDAVEATRELEPQFLKRPHIMVYDQLKQDVKAQFEIEQFRHKEFDIETSGDNIFDIDFGDSFYLLNANIVSDSDNSTNNNIKLVAKRIEYSITKAGSGPGGLRRRIRGVKRFT